MTLRIKKKGYVDRGKVILAALSIALLLISLAPQTTHAQTSGYVCPTGWGDPYEPTPKTGSVLCKNPNGTDIFGRAREFKAINKTQHKCSSGLAVGAEWEEGSISLKATCVDSGGAKVGGASDNPSCNGLSEYFYSPITCIGRTMSVYLATAAITISAWLLAIASYLFNVLVDHVVVGFGKTVFATGVMPAIEVGWTALRDVANIVIIAMFVFIAINIILGVKEFGEKRLIARVLIVAVLINFSLLFTKAIIDASNFTAYQFITASGFIPNNRDATGAVDKEFVKKGIAGEFIKVMGLASIADTRKALTNASFGSEEKMYENANAWFALLHGLVSATLLLMAAAVLFYACYFLITRAVLLIFLMMTSALAFASWLIPQQRIVKGFARWWETLLKAALFGPLLMIFLWASLNVARAIAKTTNGKGTLGAMISNPNDTLNLEALWSYAIVLGLLFASVYAANILSQGIAGFSAAGKFWGMPFFTATSAVSRTVGLAGRGILGAPAGYLARQIQDRGLTAAPGLRGAAGRAAWRPLASLARSSFDAMNVGAVRSQAAKMGAFTLGREVGKGGYFGVKERQAEQIDKLARAMAPSGAARGQLAGQAATREDARVTGERQVLDTQLAAAQTTLQGTQRQAQQARAAAERNEHADQQLARQTTRGNVERDHEEAQRRVQGTEDELQALRSRVAQQITSAAPAAQAALRQAADQQIAAISQRLQTERAALAHHVQTLNDWDTAVRQAGDNVANALTGPAEQAVQGIETQINQLERGRLVGGRLVGGRADRVQTARTERQEQLGSQAISEAMARNKIVGSEEIIRQLGGARDKAGLRALASQLGASGGRMPAQQQPQQPPPQQTP